jgi:TolB-like protein
MKKIVTCAVMLMAVAGVFAQQLPTVAVATFDTTGGITADEAAVVTELFMAELVSKGTVNVVDRGNFDKIITEMEFQTKDWSDSRKTAQLGRALNAQYIIRGQLMKMGDIYWTATMIDINTAQVLFSAREQMSDLGQIWSKLPGFCAQMLAKMPAPNYFVGRWRSSYYNLICILEFKTDGSIVVSQYDAQENNSRQRGSGTGNYSLGDNTVRINLTLNGVASRFNVINGTTPYRFDSSKNGFT